MEEIYLDNASTTRVCKSAMEKVVYMMERCYGNPSSMHKKGFEAEKHIQKSRAVISEFIGCSLREIYFTSGGTESNNLGILGVAKVMSRYGKRIITTATEHASVLSCMKELEKQGFDIVYINPDTKGNISCSDIESVMDKNTILVSMMMVNNETGAIYPIEEVSRIIKRKAPNALFHVDAVQGFGKHPLKISNIKADILSISSHKIHGPKGVGAVYISKGIRVCPLLFGGGQEYGMRSGTVCTSGIAGFGQAVKEIGSVNAKLEKISNLNRYLREKLSDIECVVINSSDEASPYILNFSAVGIKSETMLNFLSERGIYVSSGSACGKGKRSHVLEAMSLPPNIIDSSIRVSLSAYNTMNDIDIFIDYFKQGTREIAKK